MAPKNRFASILSLFGILLLLSSCSRQYVPDTTYSVEQIKQDFKLMRHALEESHPGIYRYTSPDSIRWVFDQTEKLLDHPMTELEFRRTVNPIFSYIRCGHTDIYPSKGYSKYIKKNKPKEFPLGLYYVENKLRILQNRTDDTSLVVGTEVVSIDGQPAADIIAKMRQLVPSDGYNQTFKTTVINGNFGGFYRYLYGNKETFEVTVQDSLGKKRGLKLSFNKPPKPTKKASIPVKTASNQPPKTPVATPKLMVKTNPKLRTLKLSEKDSTVAILDINTFSDDRYRRFYRRSFKALKTQNIKHLIIDLRANGGGKSDASINLMSYLLDSNYTVYDTAAAITLRPSYQHYYGHKFPRFFTRYFWSKKLPDGRHSSRSAQRVQKPTRRYGFKGQVYLLTNGGSFSAAAIFPSMIQQYNPRAVVIGRETGGGRHGCNAFISPYLTLPHTQAKVRIPVFKLVLNIPGADIGHGVQPNYPIEYRFEDVRKARDLDVERAYELIKASKSEK